MRNFITWTVWSILIYVVAGVILYSCHSSGSGRSTGSVAVYVTDDMSELFSQVTATVDKIQLISTGTATTCDILIMPTAVNIANLKNVMQLLNVAQCPATSFNRIHIEFDKGVQLFSGSTGTISPCSFESYKDESRNQPNVLNCDSVTGICSLDINGAVNVLAQDNNKMGLDFNLKDFDVTGQGTSLCAVTMKVSPLNASGFKGTEAVTGIISQLNTGNRTFVLTKNDSSFNVIYSGITGTVQPDLDILLQRAQADGLKTKVSTTTIDLTTKTVSATAILVKVEGTVNDLVSGASFTVNYGAGRKIGVDYALAREVDGGLSNGAWVDVRLLGFSNTNSLFLAEEVEVESQGMMTED